MNLLSTVSGSDLQSLGGSSVGMAQSEVSIFLEEIPVAQEAKVFAGENGLVSEELALFGGEEYELVLTVRKDRFESLKRRIPSLQRIGTVKSGLGDVIMDYHGKNRKVEPRGYEHFT